jgi:Family of unknown function (DUF6152)
MKHTLLALFAIAAGFLVIPYSAYAHHGFAGFDRNSVATYQGTVTDFHYVNPHSVVEFDVKDAKGQVQNWQGEMTSPSHLAPLGWKASSLEAGDQITISGYPAKNGRPTLWVTKIIANGKELKIDWRE